MRGKYFFKFGTIFPRFAPYRDPSGAQSPILIIPQALVLRAMHTKIVQNLVITFMGDVENMFFFTCFYPLVGPQHSFRPINALDIRVMHIKFDQN